MCRGAGYRNAQRSELLAERFKKATDIGRGIGPPRLPSEEVRSCDRQVANREHSTQFNRHFPDGHDRDDEPDCSASVIGRKISRTQGSCEYTFFLQLD